MKVKPLVLSFCSLLFLPPCLLLAICYSQKPSVRKTKGPQFVEVRDQNGAYQLVRNGAPYFIKGACVYNHFDLLPESGGNSIRLYNVNADSALVLLDQAHSKGLTVTVGLNVLPSEGERINEEGTLDYGNEAAVQAQRIKLKEDILKLKDHPALLMWGIGNELNARIKPNQFVKQYRLWHEVNTIASMIHELDPNHPATTMIPNLDPMVVYFISVLCSEVDLLSLNVFWRGGEIQISQKLAYLGWYKPFVISEYAHTGYWNSTERTDWHASRELTSFNKASFIQTQYKELLYNDTAHCLGGYVFIWAQKQEYTSTWFSLFTQDRRPTEVVDMMQYLWTSRWPANRSPNLASIEILDSTNSGNVYLNGGQKFKAELIVSDYENDNLNVKWEIQKDNVDVFFDATKGQAKPEILEQGESHIYALKTKSNSQAKIRWEKYILKFQAPPKEGPYRLFLYVSGKNSGAATGNVPFYVIK